MGAITISHDEEGRAVFETVGGKKITKLHVNGETYSLCPPEHDSEEIIKETARTARDLISKKIDEAILNNVDNLMESVLSYVPNDLEYRHVARTVARICKQLVINSLNEIITYDKEKKE